MKKLILLAFTILMIVGCEKKVAYTADETKVVIIDSCEYLKCYTYGFSCYVYSHKGNCRYCAQRRKAELEEFAKLLIE